MTEATLLAQLSTECKAEEFERRLANELFSRLPAQPNKREMDMAKLLLQELFHHYRRKNEKVCYAQHFTSVHRCILQVYIDAYERLEQLQTSTAPPALPSIPQRKVRVKTAPQAAPPSEETILGIIDASITLEQDKG